MKILHVAYSLSESSAATRLAESQEGRQSIYFLLGRPSRFSFVRQYQIYVMVLSSLSFLFRVWEKLLCRVAGIAKDDVFSFGTNSVIQKYILRRAIKRYRIDIVHLHWGGVGFMPLSVVSGLTVPVVITAHDYHFFTGGCHVPMGCAQFNIGCAGCPLTANRLIQSYISKNMLRNAEILRTANIHIIAPSQYTKDRIAKAHPGVKISVVPNTLGSFYDLNGRSVDRMLKIYEKHRCGNVGIRTIVVVGVNGSLRQNKGKDILIQTLQNLQDKKNQIRLITVGECVKVDGLLEQVNVPSASSSELMQWYAIADLCIVPSRYETFSQVTLEAIVCGTPVVAFDLTGPRDIIEDAVSGYLVPPFDAGAFATTVEMAIKHKQNDTSRMTTSAVKALQDYSPIVISSRHDVVYQKCRLHNGSVRFET